MITFQAWKDDIAQFKNKVVDLNSTASNILENCDDKLSKDIKTKSEKLNKRWKETLDVFNKKSDNLQKALEKTEAMYNEIENFEKWLNDTEKEIPSPEQCNITNANELYQMKTRFQNLKEKCDNRTQEFRNLNERGSDVMLQSDKNPLADLAKRFTHLNARWTQVTDAIYERCKLVKYIYLKILFIFITNFYYFIRVIQEASLEFSELTAWLTQEKTWLDGLQRKLCKSPNAPADAEEISDELYVCIHLMILNIT